MLPENTAAEVDLDSIPVLPVFRWLASTGGIVEAEMLRTFNCGIGMVAVVAREGADAVMASLAAAGEQPVLIGEITPPAGERSAAKGKGDAWAVTYEGTLRFAD